MIRHGRARVGCEDCARDALEVTDEYATWENSTEAEVLAWRCRECGDGGEDLLPLLADDLDLVA